MADKKRSKKKGGSREADKWAPIFGNVFKKLMIMRKKQEFGDATASYALSLAS